MIGKQVRKFMVVFMHNQNHIYYDDLLILLASLPLMRILMVGGALRKVTLMIFETSFKRITDDSWYHHYQIHI